MTKFSKFNYTLEELEELKNKDIVLRKAIEKIGRVDREIIKNLFQALVYAIIGQLISAKASKTIYNRLEEKVDINPEAISKKSIEEIQALGLTFKKAEAIKNLSIQILNEEINLETLEDLEDEEVIRQLSKIKGIGRWTAEMLLINSMERKDILSFGDIAIKRGMCKVYNLESITKETFDKYKKLYSPYGSIASIYLWNISFIKDFNGIENDKI